MGKMIRAAREADLDHLHALIERAYRGDEARATWTNEADIIGGPRTSRANLVESIADPARRLLVAEEAGSLTGCVEITDKARGLAYVGLLTVDPTLQQGGLGKALLTAGEETAQSDFGAARIEMTVVELRGALIAYYQRRGYKITGETRPFPAVASVVFLTATPPAMTVLEKVLAEDAVAGGGVATGGVQ